MDGLFGLLRTGHLDEAYVIRLLQRLPEGTYELYAHPRLDTDQGRRELAALVSPQARRIVQARGIHLTSYGQL